MDAIRLTGDRAAANDRSTADLTRDLVHEITTLMHDEMALAQAEMTAKGKRAGIGAGMFGGAGVLAFLGLAAFAAAAIAAISLALPVWAAALIVGGALFAGAGIAALMGRKEMKEAMPPAPTETIENAKEDVEWIKEHATSETR
jgi:hypothetical protein